MVGMNGKIIEVLGLSGLDILEFSVFDESTTDNFKMPKVMMMIRLTPEQLGRILVTNTPPTISANVGGESMLLHLQDDGSYSA